MNAQTPHAKIDEALYHELVELARPHVEGDPRLGILDYDTQKYEWQAYDYYCAQGEVADVALLDFIGGRVVHGFVEMSDELMTEERRQQTRDVLRDEKSLYIATSHSNLIDPAIALAAITNPLRREESQQDDLQTGIIINKMIGVIKYLVDEQEDQWLPCMQVLQWLCGRTYMSFPQSKTFRDSEAAKVLPEGHIQAHNGKIKEEITSWLSKGGVALGVAPSGSTHKLDEKGKRSTLPKITNGTAEMMAHENIRVLPLIMDLDANRPFMQIAGNVLYHVKRRQGAHRIAREMAKALNKRNTEQAGCNPYHVYEGRPGRSDVPLLRRLYIAQEPFAAGTA